MMKFPTEWKNKLHVLNHQPVDVEYLHSSCGDFLQTTNSNFNSGWKTDGHLPGLA
jgi:hypothetical protein